MKKYLQFFRTLRLRPCGIKSAKEYRVSHPSPVYDLLATTLLEPMENFAGPARARSMLDRVLIEFPIHTQKEIMSKTRKEAEEETVSCERE